MKRTVLSFAVMAMALAVSAQTMNVHFKNGTKVEYDNENVDYVDFTEKPSDPTLTAGDYVDLGLSVKWASCNLGATTPYGGGNGYAWGETSQRNGEVTKDNYAYYDKSKEEYIGIGDNISGTEYDAATVNLGNGWRMPTKQEVKELESKCEWKKSKLKVEFEWGDYDVPGYYITAPNGNSIFLPLRASYWTSNGSWSEYATQLHFAYGYPDLERSERFIQHAIRPVYSPSRADGIANITDYITVRRTETSEINNSLIITYLITNSCTEKIFLSNMGKHDIIKDLEAGSSYSLTVQEYNILSYHATLVFTYNGKSYTVEE